jgi:L-serine deaminase
LKLNVKVEVPDEYIKILVEEEGLTEKQAIKITKRTVQRAMLRALRAVVEADYLLRAGVSPEKVDALIEKYKMKVLGEIPKNERPAKDFKHREKEAK